MPEVIAQEGGEMNSPVLPLEVVYHIIKDIDPASPEGRQSLSACSYAHSTLRIICQERIFQDVKISYVPLGTDVGLILLDDEGTTGRRFSDLLASSPHIGAYVQNLTLDVLSPLGRARSFTYSECSSATAFFSLYAIVPRLTNLKGLITSHPGPYAWSGVEERTKTFFMSIIPLATKLNLYLFANVPFSVFSACVSLEELRVASLHMDAANITQSCAAKINLSVLEIGFPAISTGPLGPWFSAPHSPLSLSQLRSLKVSVPGPPVPHIDELLKLCTNTLEELDFHLVLHDDSLQPPFTGKTPSLALLRNLRHLTIRTRVRGRPYRPWSPERLKNDLLYAATTLKTLPFEAFCPRQLQLTLWIKVLYLFDFERSLPLLPGWSDLLSVLDSSQSSPFFAGVELILQCFNYNERPVHISISLTDLTHILDKNEGLKKLREKGVLSYACS